MNTVLLVLNLLTTLGLVLLVTGFLPSYVREKGKNLATREDVEEITRKVEAIRAEYAQMLQAQSDEEQGRRDRAAQVHAMRLAAVDKRLEACQEAFALWRELLGNMHGPDIGKVVMKCQEWWNAHCLYLDQEARQAFYDAYGSAANHEDLKQMIPRNEVATRLIHENMERIRAAGPALVRAAALPPLVDKEHQIVDTK